MLSVRHITHKLRSQSLNEDSHHYNHKSDPDRDSGTESDDELDDINSTTSSIILIDKMEQEGTVMDSSAPSVRRRERTRSESGKENSSTTTTSATPASSIGVSAVSTGGAMIINSSASFPAGGAAAALAAARQRRSGQQPGLREQRYTEAALASAVAALSAADTDDPQRVLVADSPIEFCVTDSALPSDSDHGGPWGDQHSSEEELECINGPEQLVSMMAGSGGAGGMASSSPSSAAGTVSSAFRFGPSAFGPPGDKSSSSAHHRRGKTPQQQGPEKRKWAQVSPRRGVVVTPSSGGSAELVRIRSRPRSAVLFQQQQYLAADGYAPSERSSSSISATNLDCCYSASSDDEVQALVGGNTSQDSPLPLEFRTSPPVGAHRSYPTRSLSPPPKLFLTDDEDHRTISSSSSSSTPVTVVGTSPLVPPTTALAALPANGSPRKRHRHAHHHQRSSQQQHNNIQRPCLDFEKMQQMKNRSVSTWRHDGELSLFCW